ncbi:MAG: hypothetical protein KGY99_00385 [Phycisphaerae bacterium]|nr:hypothetical protein [Phycisphaerae bacterium]
MSPVPRHAVCVVTAVFLGAAQSGCIAHHPVTPEQMDRYWTLRPDPVEGADLYRPVVSQTKLPGKWIIRREESLLRSTISIVQALDRLDEGAPVIDLSVSDEHAEMLSEMLSETRAALEELQRLSRASATGDYDRWAETLAHALAQFERISRLAAGRPGDEGAGEGVSARPVLEMLAVYLNEQTGGTLLGGLGGDDVSRLRRTLGHLTLRLGFAISGRRPPDGLLDETLDRLAAAEDPYAAEEALAELLLAQVRDAEPVARSDTLAGSVRSAVDAGVKAVAVLDHLVRQWDRVDRVELALRRRAERDGNAASADDSGVVLEALVAVRAGHEVRLADVVPFQPVVTFAGTSRIAVVPSAPPTGELVVSFNAVSDDGGVALRFEGLIYALARLLVVPIDDAHLREVRVLSESRRTGTGLLHVSVLLEATGGRGDRRRMIVYEQAARREVRRRPFAIAYPLQGRLRTFSYLTPTRRYTYRSVKGDAGWFAADAEENSSR